MPNAPLKLNKTNGRNTSPPPKSVRRPEERSSVSPRQGKTQEFGTNEPVKIKMNLISVRGYNNPKLNDVTVNQDVLGMSVQPCNIHSMTTWKQISEEKSDSQVVQDVPIIADLETQQVTMEVPGTVRSQSVTDEKRSIDDEFEKAAERHRQRMLASQKVEESTPSSEIVERSDAPKISWAMNIEKLDKTYLIAEARDSEPESPKLVVPSRKWKPVKNSPRVEFRTKDNMAFALSKPVSNVFDTPDSFESPMNFDVNVKFTSTPFPDGLGASNNGANSEFEGNNSKDIRVSEDFEYCTESGAGWSGGMKLHEPIKLELGFLESVEDYIGGAPSQSNVLSLTPEVSAVDASPESETNITEKKPSPQVRSPGTDRKKKDKPEVKDTPRSKPPDETAKVTENSLNCCDSGRGYESPTVKQIYSPVDRPIPRQRRKNKSPSKNRRRRTSNDDNQSHVKKSVLVVQEKIDAHSDEEESKSPLNSTMNTEIIIQSPLDEVRSAEISPRTDFSSTKCVLKSPKMLKGQKESCSTERRRKIGATCKRFAHLNLCDDETRAVDDSTSHLEESSKLPRKSPDTLNSPKHSATISLSNSLKPDFSDRRRCGTYVIEKRSVPNVSTSCDPASDESLENMPSGEKRRRTESTSQDLDVTNPERDDTLIDTDPREDCSLNGSLTASKIFMETTVEDITLNDEMREIYDKYVNNNFDYDSENTVGGSYSNEQALLDDKDDVLEDDHELVKATSDSDVMRADRELPQPSETPVSRSSCGTHSEMQRRIRKSMNILRGSTDSLVSMVDTGSRSIQLTSSSGCYDREICTIEPIASGSSFVLKMDERSSTFLPDISQVEPPVELRSMGRKCKTYWEKVANASQNKLINLDPPNERFRLVKRNPKTQFLPPMNPANSSFTERPR